MATVGNWRASVWCGGKEGGRFELGKGPTVGLGLGLGFGFGGESLCFRSPLCRNKDYEMKFRCCF